MASDFSLENFAEKIHYGKTKSYFQEVMSSYQNGNYRSAVVMLWSVAVCDIVYKLQNLVDLYDDTHAKKILDELTNLQNADPKSSAWEIQLIDKAWKQTNLIDNLEHENLCYLQTQRHLSAHPILNSNRELYAPNKETVRALMRNTLEGLLIKPPFYTKKITDSFLADIAETALYLNTKEKFKKFIEGKYLSRLTPDVEISIYKSLWKLAFRTKNDNCNKNRKINRYTLDIIGKRHDSSILSEKIKGDVDYYSNISSDPIILNHLVFYLSKNKDFYEALDEAAKLKIKHHIENTENGRLCSWFLKDSLDDYYSDIIEMLKNKSDLTFSDNTFRYLLSISDTEEWQQLFCKILSIYYCMANSFDEADFRFEKAISPYLYLFDKDNLFFLIEEIEASSQVYRRRKASEDHKQIYQKLTQLCGQELDLTPYPNFRNKLPEE